MRQSSFFGAVRAHAYYIALAGLLIAGIWLRAAPVSLSRFHEDEALYAYWGMQITTGADPMLNQYPVDKPPLFPYLLSLLFGACGATEVVARLPSLAASSISILLVASIGRRVYGRPAALVAAVGLTICPFDIAFAGTVFTDPLLVMWILAALAAAIAGRAFLTGLLFGLAFETKQQAILFAPLIIAGFAMCGRGAPHERPAKEVERTFWQKIGDWFGNAWSHAWTRGLIGGILGIAPGIWWDLARTQRPGFLAQSIISYGGLRLAPWGELGERAAEWLDMMGMFTGAPALNWLLVIAIFARLAVSFRTVRQGIDKDVRRRARFDLLLAGFSLLFLLVHWIVDFNVWDRYVLGLVPLLALLAGRALILPSRLITGRQARAGWMCAVYTTVAAAILIVSMAGPATVAARGRYPVGGDHGVYQGIDQVADYLRDHVPAHGVIHHRWLGWHYLYYMYTDPHAFRWHSSPEELLAHVNEWPEVPHWITFPEWQDRSDVASALQDEGWYLEEMHIIRRPDGSISFRICRIVRFDR